ncbi:hypothetical protein ACLOJK_005357 [Asimina triloba]
MDESWISDKDCTTKEELQDNKSYAMDEFMTATFLDRPSHTQKIRRPAATDAFRPIRCTELQSPKSKPNEIKSHRSSSLLKCRLWVTHLITFQTSHWTPDEIRDLIQS